MRQSAPERAAYLRFRPITTRWSDNDAFGHINNVRYYEFFDTVVNAPLIDAGLLDVVASPVVGVVVETRCRYFAPLAFPEPIEGGLAVERIGASSITYRIGIFAVGAARAAAAGVFTHVYVERRSNRVVPVPQKLREHLSPLMIAAAV